LENNAGRLAEVTKVLAQAGINIRALSIADTSDFGILRLIVNKCDQALKALGDAGFTTRETEVAAVEIDDTPGSLARVLELLQKKDVNIEYLYASLEGKSVNAVVVLKLDDHQKAIQIFKENNIVMIESF
jgi:hypothetical protein